jgi:ribonuclease HI
MLKIHIDGACAGNPGKGAWAYIIYDPKTSQISNKTGLIMESTNNIAELSAAINAAKAIPEDREAVIYSDSQYVVKGITSWIKGWKRKGWRTETGPVKNKELWEELDSLNNKRIIWRWIPRELNFSADYLASSALEF